MYKAAWIWWVYVELDILSDLIHTHISQLSQRIKLHAIGGCILSDLIHTHKSQLSQCMKLHEFGWCMYYSLIFSVICLIHI